MVAWLARQAWQPFSPFGSHNNCSFEDETPVLVASSKGTFYGVRRGVGGFSVSARLSPVRPKRRHTHTHTHTTSSSSSPRRSGPCPVFLVWAASGSASGSCSDGASGRPCLVIREPELLSLPQGPAHVTRQRLATSTSSDTRW